ncbi:MAG TPA: hypothetical protein VHJ20_06270 [Polyangia bacterium]|nr:hypothetical protein [Polyangia bacterium]
MTPQSGAVSPVHSAPVVSSTGPRTQPAATSGSMRSAMPRRAGASVSSQMETNVPLDPKAFTRCARRTLGSANVPSLAVHEGFTSGHAPAGSSFVGEASSATT